MNVTIVMDLYADFAAACGKELQAAGYTPPAGTGADVIRAYANVQHRRVLVLLASAVPDQAAPPIAFNPSDADIKNLRKATINPITQRPDGTPHATPGGGAALDGTSTKVAALAAQTKGLCNHWEREIRPRATAMLTSGDLVAPVSLRLEQRGGDSFVVGENDKPKFKLGSVLIVPPL